MLAQDTCYAKLTGFQKNPKYMGVQWGELSVEILSLHGSRGGFHRSMSRFSSHQSVQKGRIIHVVRLFSRVSGTTSFSGESCHAQFSAPRSHTIVLTVNIML